MEQPDDNSKLMAALAHGSSMFGGAVFVPLVLWLVFRSKPDGGFVAFHALQATVRAYQGEWAGYPGMGSIGFAS